MSIQAVTAQSAENSINNLLVTMGMRVDEAVSQAIAALLRSNSHIVAGVMESAVGSGMPFSTKAPSVRANRGESTRIFPSGLQIR